MGKLIKGPLMITIPLLAVLMVVAIGISIGILFVIVTNESNGDVALIVAVALTAVIMAIAGFLSYSDYKKPQSAQARASSAPKGPTSASQAGPRAPVTERPARGKSRSDGRRKSR